MAARRAAAPADVATRLTSGDARGQPRLFARPFDSKDGDAGLRIHSKAARRLHEDVFDTMYFAACEASCELTERDNLYATFADSPASQGRLLFEPQERTPKTVVGTGTP